MTLVVQRLDCAIQWLNHYTGDKWLAKSTSPQMELVNSVELRTASGQTHPALEKLGTGAALSVRKKRCVPIAAWPIGQSRNINHL